MNDEERRQTVRTWTPRVPLTDEECDNLWKVAEELATTWEWSPSTQSTLNALSIVGSVVSKEYQNG